MRFLKWRSIFMSVYLLCLMLPHMTRGMPTAIQSRKPKSPVVRNDGIDINAKMMLKENEKDREKKQLSVTENEEDEWSNEQPPRTLDSDPTPYEVEQTDSFIEPEDSVVEDVRKLEATEKANKPLDTDDLFINDTTASRYNLTSFNANDGQEIEENVEQNTEEPVLPIYKHKVTDPAEIRLPDTSNKFATNDHLSEHKDIGTAFSLSDDFTDTELTIDTSPPSNETMVEEVVETLETVDLSSEDDANIPISHSTPYPSPSVTTKAKLFQPIYVSETDEQLREDLLTPSSQTPTVDSKLASDEMVDGLTIDDQTVMATALVATENVENEDDIPLTAKIPSTTSTTTTSRPKIASTYVRSTSPRPNTSPRPTIRRRITDSTTSTTSPEFLFTTTKLLSSTTTSTSSKPTTRTITTPTPPPKTTKLPIITATTKLPSTSIPITSQNPLHADITVTKQTESTYISTTQSTSTVPPTTTTTKKQFLITVQPLEDDFPVATYTVDTEDNLTSDVVDENGTLPATTSLDFNGLWNLFSVEATNAIIISGIIGGCAVIFFATVMVSCMWRQKASRRPAYPPTESSNCSSNSSASSFPASTTKTS